jgi:hypothetical protein
VKDPKIVGVGELPVLDPTDQLILGGLPEKADDCVGFLQLTGHRLLPGGSGV